jgi:hypothetical protein
LASATLTPADPELEDTGGAPVTQQPSPAEPPSFGKNNRDLPDILKDVLADLVKELQLREQYDRRTEVLGDRRLRFYDDGIQHFYPNYGTGVYQIGEAGGSVNLGDGEQECSEFLGAYNIFRARRRTIDAVLTQNPPGIIFEPDKQVSEDMEASEVAEGYRHLFDQKNDVADMQQTATRYFELSGRVVAWTHTSTNRQKWGLNDQGQPRQMETTEIFGTLESRVPIICRNQDGAGFCFLFKDPDYLIARELNPWLKEDDVWKFAAGESSIGETDWDRYARLGVRQAKKGNYQITATLNHVVTEMHCFLRPANFQHTKCDPIYTGPQPSSDENAEPSMEAAVDEEGNPLTIADMLRKLFPEGVHIVYIGKAYSEATPESMDDCIDIVMSEKRDSMTGGALMEPMVVVQDGFNDFKNAERENYEKGWPMTHFRGDGDDYDAIVDTRSAPGQRVLIKNPVGPTEEPLSNNFFTEPGFDTPESFVNCMEEYRTALSQDITGASPALQGVAGPHDQTATERTQDKAQSMGILGPTWSRVQILFSGIYKKAALAASKNPDHAKSIVVALGNKQTTTIQLEKLKRGNFHCKPDEDSTFPESTSAKRATLATMLPQIGASPVGAEFFNSPDNWEALLRLNGFPQLVFTPAEAFRKQVRELEILTRESPVPNPAVAVYNQQHAALAIQAMAEGLPEPPYQPPPPEISSILPKKRDYHKWELAKCQEWLSSEDCWRLEVEGDAEPSIPGAPPKPVQPGYSQNDHVRNVELHADAHEELLNQQMAAAAAQQMAQKPPTESINYKDESPAGQAAMNKQAGLDAGAPAVGNKQVQGNAQPPGAPGKQTV